MPYTKEQMRLYMREYRSRLLDQGRCVACGAQDERTRDGFPMCAACKEYRLRQKKLKEQELKNAETK